MNVFLRSASVLALGAAALAASAQTTYTFVSSTVNLTIVTGMPATSTANATTSYAPPAVTGTSGGFALTQASINVASSGTTFGVSGLATDTSGNFSFAPIFFPVSLLTTSGTASVLGNRFTSVVGPVQVTPEPSALAALGLGVVAFVRRRKRA